MLSRAWSFTLFGLLCVAASAQARADEVVIHDPAQIAAAAEKANPGDVIVLADGTYTDADILFSARGSETRPVTLRAETPGGVTLTGRSKLRIAGEHLLALGFVFHNVTGVPEIISFRRDSKLLSNHCRLTDCVVACDDAAEQTESKWVSIYGVGHRVDQCCFAGKRSGGATLVVWLPEKPEQPPAHRIDHNHFGPRPPLKKNGGETIRIGDSPTSLQSAQCIVEHNLFEQCDGEAEIISNKSCDNIYRHNTFRECQGALTLRHGNRCTVEGNFFLGHHRKLTGGVRVIGEEHRVLNNYFDSLEGDESRSALSIMNGLVDSPAHGYIQVRGATVAFNTFVDCKHNLVVGLADDDDAKTQILPPTDCTITSNLFVGLRNGAVEFLAQPTNARFADNLAQGGPEGPLPPGFQRIERAVGEGAGAFRPLLADSEAINGGQPGLVHRDIEGEARDEKPDVGADEHADGEPLFHPLSAEDVGPEWRRQ